MIELRRTLEYLENTNLTIEEFLLLYTIYVRNNSPDDVKTLQLSKVYYQRNTFYDIDNQPTKISYDKMVKKLIKDDFLFTYQDYCKESKGFKYLDLTKLQTTSKFDETMFSDDRMKWWQHFIEIYGLEFYLNNNMKPVSTLLCNKGETSEHVINKFWQRCGNGNMFLIGRLMEQTKDYVLYFGNNLKITNYLDSFDNLMISLEAKLKEVNEPSHVSRQF